MSKRFKSILLIGSLALLFLLGQCKNEEDPTPANPNAPIVRADFTGDTFSRQFSGEVSGSVLFAKRSDNSMQVTIQLVNAPGLHPAHIHNQTDRIIVDLDGVENNKSVTDVDASILTYEDLTRLKGYVAVHRSPQDFDVIGRVDLN